MANSIIVRNSPLTTIGPYEIYEFLIGANNVVNRTPGSFTVITATPGVTIAVTGAGFVYDGPSGTGPRPIGGTYATAIIIKDGVPTLEYRYSPGLSVVAFNNALATYDLYSNPAQLDALLSAQPTTHTGGVGRDTLFGLDGIDIFNGGAGGDVLNGRGGSDTYNLGAFQATIVDTSGVDTVTSTITRSLAIYPTIEKLTLLGNSDINGTGNALANTITGNTGDNDLNGGTGIDRLVGGLGDDYYITDGGDTIVENSGGGSDTVYSSVTYTLGANLEELILTGTSAINGTGNALPNLIIGNGSRNTLNGGTGADRLSGQKGNDVYITDGGDTVVEYADGGSHDLVYSSVTYQLTADVEELTLTGALAINGTGNTLANVITGNSAANTLNGTTGVDELAGEGGNDTYVTDGGDTMVEEVGGGVDRVLSSAGHELDDQVENLILTGIISVYGTGNGQVNLIVGNAGNNVLNGLQGSDRLTGGAGKDAFVFNTAAHSTTNNDRITDFSVVDDTIRIENAVFTKFGTAGALNPVFFKIGPAAADANDFIIYNNVTGALSYDTNGNVAGGAVQFATLAAGLALTSADFLII